MIRYIPLLICLFILTACGSKTTVILLPEDDGQTGQVIVKNQASETRLDKAYTATNVGGETAKLSNAQPMDQNDVKTSYAGLFNAEPPEPAHFILYFKTNTATLTDASLKMIPKVLDMSKEREPSQISVIGHTDTKGSTEHNIELSLQRAQAVADLLKSSGIQLKDMSINSYGENDLLITTPDNVSEPKNRRVEVMIR